MPGVWEAVVTMKCGGALHFTLVIGSAIFAFEVLRRWIGLHGEESLPLAVIISFTIGFGGSELLDRLGVLRWEE